MQGSVCWRASGSIVLRSRASSRIACGLLREFGIVIPVGADKVRPAVLSALEDGDNELPMALRHALAGLLEQVTKRGDVYLRTLHRSFAVMASVSAPEAAKPITILAVNHPPIERVALLRGFHDGPSNHAHPKAEYTTATVPLCRSAKLRIDGGVHT